MANIHITTPALDSTFEFESDDLLVDMLGSLRQAFSTGVGMWFTDNLEATGPRTIWIPASAGIVAHFDEEQETSFFDEDAE